MAAKIGTIKWHEEKIAQIRATHSKKAKARHAAKRARQEGEDKYNRNKYKLKKPPKYKSRIEYDFLRYIKIIFRWATDNHPELSRSDVEILLYLYGMGAFSRKQFKDFHDLFAFSRKARSFTRFVKDGWIRLWRPRVSKEEVALYILTTKATYLCSRMHKYACGDLEIPENYNANKMYATNKPKINQLYTKMLERMNKERRGQKNGE